MRSSAENSRKKTPKKWTDQSVRSTLVAQVYKEWAVVQEIERILDGLDDKDRKIILCARSEFAKYGFYNANMDRIALSAGLGKGTLYRRFISKQILFFVTIQADQRELLKRLEHLDENLPLRQLIEEHLNAAVDYIVENVDLLKLAMHEYSKVLEGIAKDELKELVRSMHRLQTTFWRRMVSKAMQGGELSPDTNEEMVASILTGMLRAIHAEIFVTGDEDRIDRNQIIERNTLFIHILFEGLFRSEP